MNTRELIEELAGALDEVVTPYPLTHSEVDAVIAKAREYLAAPEQSEPVRREVAESGSYIPLNTLCCNCGSLYGSHWGMDCYESGEGGTFDSGVLAPQPEQSEPIGFFDFQERGFYWAKYTVIGAMPVSIKVEPMALYAQPKAPEQSEPMIKFKHGCKWCGKLEGCEHAPPLRELSVEQACVLWHESNQDIYVFAKAILAAARSKTP